MLAIGARIRMYKGVIEKTVFHNVETWSDITEKEMEGLENLQRRIIRGMCEMSKTTPYIGLLAEF